MKRIIVTLALLISSSTIMGKEPNDPDVYCPEVGKLASTIMGIRFSGISHGTLKRKLGAVEGRGSADLANTMIDIAYQLEIDDSPSYKELAKEILGKKMEEVCREVTPAISSK